MIKKLFKNNPLLATAIVGFLATVLYLLIFWLKIEAIYEGSYTGFELTPLIDDSELISKLALLLAHLFYYSLLIFLTSMLYYRFNERNFYFQFAVVLWSLVYLVFLIKFLPHEIPTFGAMHYTTSFTQYFIKNSLFQFINSFLVYIGIYLVPIIYSFIRFHKIYQDKQSEAIALFVNITFFNIAIAAFNLIYSFSHPLAILYFFDQEPKSAVLAILVMILILIACFFIAFKLIIYLNSKDKEAQIKKNKQIKINYLVPRLKQNGLNCGPFALAQVLQYYGEIITAEELIQGTKMVQGIGTYESNLALTAKKLGYKTKITTQNLYLFDPTWQELSQNELIVKLQEQEKELKDKDLTQSAQGFIEYLQAGGKLGSETIDRDLLVDKLGRGPLVVGLNMTYLYQEKRPLDKEAKRYGHFVTVSGYDGENDTFTLIDPWHSIPFSKDGIYQVKSARLIAAIYLAEATFDASLLEVYQ